MCHLFTQAVYNKFNKNTVKVFKWSYNLYLVKKYKYLWKHKFQIKRFNSKLKKNNNNDFFLLLSKAFVYFNMTNNWFIKTPHKPMFYILSLLFKILNSIQILNYVNHKASQIQQKKIK